MKADVMNDDSRLEVVSLFKRGDWQTLLNLVSRGELGELYLWVHPTEQDLHYLARELTSAGIQSVLSVGCGTGLLEWLLQSVTGLQVQGLEVDRSWWESPYSPPTFIPLHYADEDDVVCSPQTALLFCYFNNRPAFLNYVASFTGKCVVVIGPDEGSGRHTDPQPFDSQLHDMGWTVQSATKIQNTVDYIVIYRPQSLPH
ncbi:uncharacterized protein [Anabrus simplex]|uniref:uncharacterized protein n=1 Tax=Anabrus simplex TaxID=316456 RepID=UPI0034DD91F4